MENLIFNQLLVKSNTQKSANHFKFSKTLNLITADDNSFGKTTLVKLLYWTFGCDVFFDTTWISLDCETAVDFSIGENKYLVSRYKDIIFLREAGKDYIYPKITGDYSIKIAEILNFKLRLPSRNTGKLETPPPAFYFLPYYIDQKRSWAKALDNFDKLGQFANWQSNTLKYHTGLISEEYFIIEDKVIEDNEIKKGHEDKIDKYNSAVDIIEDIMPRNNTAIEDSDLEDNLEKIRSEVNELSSVQEKLYIKISDYQNELSFLTEQKNINIKIIDELDKDYKFSVENIVNDQLECPLCGVLHDNSLISRASIVSDKNNAINQLEILNKKIIKIEDKISKLESEKHEIIKKINKANNEFISLDKNYKNQNIKSFISSISSNTVQSQVTKKIDIEVVEVDKLENSIKERKKDQKKLITKEEKEDIYSNFLSYLVKYINKLGVNTLNLSKIKKPTDYSIIQKEGGAAEGSRAMLAYYLSIYSSIKTKPNTCLAPLTIDTPNQHEQSHINYSKIVNLLMDDIYGNSQIFLCAMKNSELNKYQEKAELFELNENKVLAKDKYIYVNNMFSELKIKYSDK